MLPNEVELGLSSARTAVSFPLLHVSLASVVFVPLLHLCSSRVYPSLVTGQHAKLEPQLFLTEALVIFSLSY